MTVEVSGTTLALIEPNLTRGFPVILNPASGRGRGARYASPIKTIGLSLGLNVQILLTTGPGDGQVKAANLLSQGAPVIGVAGGDGLISEVVGALAGSSSAIAILPTGTGNDLARHLRLPLNIDAAMRSIKQSVIVPIDTGVGNGIPFVVACGCGFDAAVAEEVNKGGVLLKGPTAFAAAVVKQLWNYQPTRLRVCVDGESVEFEGYFVVASNASSYGGGMKIAPLASVRDGLLDICCVHSLPRHQFLTAAAQVYHGGHTGHPAVLMLSGKSIQVESDPPAPINIDGETQGLTPLSIEVAPASLNVLIPRLLLDHPI